MAAVFFARLRISLAPPGSLDIMDKIAQAYRVGIVYPCMAEAVQQHEQQAFRTLGQSICRMPEADIRATFVKAMSSQEVQTIRGYVQALPKVQGREDAAKVAVVTDGGTEYRVLHKSAGMDLVDYISADVEVQGIVTPAPGAEADAMEEDGEVPPLFLTVRGYTLIDGYDDDWYDDDA